LALVAARAASAAPPEPYAFHFTDKESCDFPVRVQVRGKSKFTELPGGRFIAINPSTRVRLTNKEEPTHRLSYSITGAAHVTELPSGKWFVVYTGRNIFADPSYGILLTVGRFTTVLDPESGEETHPEGKGRVIDVCARLE
jgi:hypothetical protein